ncbi:MAG: hypothetical protein DMF80_11495 [Acidobacteria bacterium]|nr:MAG: hypothetical protein DMF80_11495 [Acidobacteriota bacterium]PYQ25581.1 MAG: hypothetical protein DMF81_01845 [Acidobacteriota bacterium]
MKKVALLGAVAWLAARLAGADPPAVDHQPVPCTLPEKALTLCATITSDKQVAKARVYFRSAGEKFYSFVDMVFGGLNFCGTLPAPREGKVKTLEYYVQAIDDQFESTRTSTFQMAVQPEGACEFPPVEKDRAKSAAITVYATHKDQGRKLPDGFQGAGVSFVPVVRK